MDMGGAEETEEAENVYGQILGEIGLNMEDGAVVGSSKIPQKQQAVGAAQEEEKQEDVDDLEARLAALQ